MRLNPISACLLLSGAFLCSSALSEDSVTAVIERMKSPFAIRIAYQETRYLELFDAPVDCSGFLYSLPPDGLIKEQKTPSREILGMLNQHFYYFNPQTGIHHARPREVDDPVDLRISAFQALANGNPEQLLEIYAVSFYTEPGRWYMILTEKNAAESQIRITVSGAAEQAADRFEIHESDGDRSVYELKKDAEGEKVRIAFRQLERELTGE